MSPTFRYPNDNRTNAIPDGVNIYPSQNFVLIGANAATKGTPFYYGNDNGGYYANSNRSSDLSVPDATIAEFQYPNSNVDLQNT
ncbi:hypothetical protein CMO96_01795 [Candidatus Woesebacteria bacterium]|nr:hypothetical protein [Candidatus Woesebacteria bacterium]